MIAGNSTIGNYLRAALMLLPLLVMSFFPQGTMATRGTQGVEVVLCTGTGPLTVIVDESGTPVRDPHSDAAECGWLLLGQGIALLASPATSVPAPLPIPLVAGTDHASACVADIPSFDSARAPPRV